MTSLHACTIPVKKKIVSDFLDGIFLIKASVEEQIQKNLVGKDFFISIIAPGYTFHYNSRHEMLNID